MAIRMTGLISGMDTESMVKELVNASSAKVDKVKQKKQLAEWKKEAWQGLNTKIYNFFKNEVAALKTNGTYKSKKATANDETKVSVSAAGSAANGSHTVSVKQLASSAYLTGGKITSGGGSYSTYANAGATQSFSEMTDENGNSLDLQGKTISINNGTKTVEFVLGGDGDNGVANIDELNKKLAAEEGFSGLKASVSDGKISFTNSTEKKGDDGVKTGTDFTIESEALGISGVASFEKDEANGKATSLSGDVSMKYKKDFTSSDINRGTKLSDIGIKEGTVFKVNDKEFVVDKDTTISDLTTGLSKLGVNANFDEKQGRFYINATASGSEHDFTLSSSTGGVEGEALEILGLGSAAKKIDAQDAIIDYNGVEYINSNNVFELNGLTITAKSVTGTYNKETGELTNDTPINISVSSDTEGVYNSIKNFVKKYNELIDEMNGYYNDKKPEYEPLTDDERSKLSDTQIEKWEEKAKQGLLRRDSTIESLLSSMRNILNEGVDITNDDGTTTRYTLSSLGIVTGDYSERGKLHIVGDPDDEAYSTQPNKLKETLEKNPDIFSKVLAGTSENQGIGYKLYDNLSKSMKRLEGVRSSQKFYNDITLDDEIDDFDDEIDKWQEKLSALEDKYYKQFSAMETAMAKLQSQQSYIASLMGGM